jgi:flagellar biogenesis protein FliO
MHASDWLSFALSFGIVLALLGALLYALKRMQNGNLLGMGQRRIRVIDSMSLAPRQKIVLARQRSRHLARHHTTRNQHAGQLLFVC